MDLPPTTGWKLLGTFSEAQPVLMGGINVWDRQDWRKVGEVVLPHHGGSERFYVYEIEGRDGPVRFAHQETSPNGNAFYVEQSPPGPTSP